MNTELASVNADLTAAISLSEAVAKRRDKSLADFLFEKECIDVEAERAMKAMISARERIKALEAKT